MAFSVEDYVELTEDILDLASAVGGLQADEAYVILGAFWGERSEIDLALELSKRSGRQYSQRQINRLKHRAIDKLRQAMAAYWHRSWN